MDGWAGWSGEGGPKSLPCLADRGGPPPGRVDAQADLSGASGDAGRDVQDAVAERGDLAGGQIGVAVEADQFEIGQLGKPAGDVAGVAEREWLPALVGAERRPRRVAQPELRGDVVERLVGGQGAASAYV